MSDSTQESLISLTYNNTILIDVSSWLPSNCSGIQDDGSSRFNMCISANMQPVDWLKEVPWLDSSEIFIVQAWKWHSSLSPHIPLGRMSYSGDQKCGLIVCLRGRNEFGGNCFLLQWSCQCPLCF